MAKIVASSSAGARSNLMKLGATPKRAAISKISLCPLCLEPDKRSLTNASFAKGSDTCSSGAVKYLKNSEGQQALTGHLGHRPSIKQGFDPIAIVSVMSPQAVLVPPCHPYTLTNPISTSRFVLELRCLHWHHTDSDTGFRHVYSFI